MIRRKQSAKPVLKIYPEDSTVPALTPRVGLVPAVPVQLHLGEVSAGPVHLHITSCSILLVFPNCDRIPIPNLMDTHSFCLCLVSTKNTKRLYENLPTCCCGHIYNYYFTIYSLIIMVYWLAATSIVGHMSAMSTVC